MPSIPASLDRATRSGILYGDTNGAATTTAPSSALTLSMRGFGRCILTMAAPGSGKSYAWSLTSRSPAPNDGGAGSASAWSTTALGSGTASGTDDEVVLVEKDCGDLQLTLSSPSATPSYLVYYHLTD